MAKKKNLKEFVIQQSDIDKALKYHLAKAISHSNPTSKDHSDLANHLNREEFYSYVIETVKRRIRPYDGFRKILEPVIDSLFCDKPSISIKMVDVEGGITYRTANCNGLK